MQNIRQKMANGWRDQRSWRTRIFWALLLSLAFTSTFVVFGVLEAYAQNSEWFAFGWKDFRLAHALLSLGCLLGVAGFCLLLRGKFFDLALSLVLGLTLAGYAQSYFLNLNLGSLTGDAVVWTEYAAHAVLNLLLWGILIGLAAVVRYFSEKGWRRFTALACAVMIGGQLSAAVVSYSQGAFRAGKIESRYLSEEGLLTVSAKDNVVVFLIDRLDTRFVDGMLSLNSRFLEPLDGFIRYPNYLSMYSRTFPSVTQMLTGAQFFFDSHVQEYFASAYGESTFLPDLRAAKYATRLYMPDYYAYGDVAQLNGLADNVVEGKVTVHSGAILTKLLRLSALTHAPHALKPSLWLSPSEFDSEVLVSKEPAEYLKNDPHLYQLLTQGRLTTQNETNTFTFLHLNGSHTPITMNQEARAVSGVPSVTENVWKQTMGCFQIVYEYIAQLKALGVYENATIVICGDHGSASEGRPLDVPVTTGFFLKPKGSAGTPLKTLNTQGSHKFFPATVLRAAGLDASGYGDNLLDLAEDEDIDRTYYHIYQGDKLGVYDVTGDAADFENWANVDTLPMKYLH